MTNDLVESMAGHRTRLAQEPRRFRDEREDAALELLPGGLEGPGPPGGGPAGLSPRCWLIAGVLALSPAFLAGDRPPTELAIGIGGVVLAYRALRPMADGVEALLTAAVAWERIGPIWDAASRPEPIGPPGGRSPRPRGLGRPTDAGPCWTCATWTSPTPADANRSCGGRRCGSRPETGSSSKGPAAAGSRRWPRSWPGSGPRFGIDPGAGPGSTYAGRGGLAATHRPGTSVPREPRPDGDVRVQCAAGSRLAPRARRPRGGRGGLSRPRPGRPAGSDALRDVPARRRDRLAAQPWRAEPPVPGPGGAARGRPGHPRRGLRGARPRDPPRALAYVLEQAPTVLVVAIPEAASAMRARPSGRGSAGQFEATGQSRPYTAISGRFGVGLRPSPRHMARAVRPQADISGRSVRLRREPTDASAESREFLEFRNF